jgi:excinuclease ABC subunit A
MDAICLKGVRTHNLKNLDVSIPHNKIVVITGVSGSGKSSLAFDTLYAEGQRRYVESLSAYARQFLERMEKPDLDAVTGILPAIAIEARNPVTNARSTVGTQTEINDYLRILFARVGKTYCSRCRRVVTQESAEKVAEDLLREHRGKEAAILFSIPLKGSTKKYLADYLAELEKQGFIRLLVDGKWVDLSQTKPGRIRGDFMQVAVDRLPLDEDSRPRIVDALETAYRYGRGSCQIRVGKKALKYSEGFHCAHCDLPYKRPTAHAFSFNSPLGACPACQGFGRVITIDHDLVIPDARKSLEKGAIEPWTKPSFSRHFEQLLEYCERHEIPPNKPYEDLSHDAKRRLWQGDARDPDYVGIQDFFDHLESKTYKMHVRIFLSKYRGYVTCADCGGSRLKPEALLVRFQGKTMPELLAMTVRDSGAFLDALEMTSYEKEIAGPVLTEARKRLGFLDNVGAGYLTLDRLSRTLSGGEAQRINLATSLGSSLVETLYVLDEPSIGLHERDNALVIRILKQLRDLGNTVIVVEHDRQMIEMADWVIDLGPKGGEKGGEIVFQGGFEKLLESDSLTGKYLSGRESVKPPGRCREIQDGFNIRIRGALCHNLKQLDVDIPLGCFTVLTGVSGSGKSTLVYDVLYKNYQRFRGRPEQDVGDVRSITGWEGLEDILLVDQSPIGRTPRSCPVTYVKAFDPIRRLFAGAEGARRRGLGPADFSFNVEGGRCEECEGSGKIKVEMHFLADLYVQCDRCEGKRYQDRVLEIAYRGKSIHDVLQMTVEEAVRFFADQPELVARLAVLRDVGLGYLRLGQSAVTLSAGEAQRMKLALEMSDAGKGKILYLFDEPTTGLHYDDIRLLLVSFWKLLDRGHSILAIEHNMEVIRNAHYVVDLGPEGGEEGGEVVFAGPLREMQEARPERSVTSVYLKRYLARTSSHATEPS